MGLSGMDGLRSKNLLRFTSKVVTSGCVFDYSNKYRYCKKKHVLLLNVFKLIYKTIYLSIILILCCNVIT